jgi:hypothetical protein
MHDACFGAKPPSYATIERFDDLARNFYIPPSLRIPGFPGGAGNDPTQDISDDRSLQSFMTLAIRETSKWHFYILELLGSETNGTSSYLLFAPRLLRAGARELS